MNDLLAPAAVSDIRALANPNFSSRHPVCSAKQGIITIHKVNFGWWGFIDNGWKTCITYKTEVHNWWTKCKFCTKFNIAIAYRYMWPTCGQRIIEIKLSIIQTFGVSVNTAIRMRWDGLGRAEPMHRVLRDENTALSLSASHIALTYTRRGQASKIWMREDGTEENVFRDLNVKWEWQFLDSWFKRALGQ